MQIKAIKSNSLPHVIALVGPTASGKSELAVQLAKKFNGEVLSVDSRQIYRGMDIGTGKVEGLWKKDSQGKQTYYYKDIPHYGIDIASPRKDYSVVQFQRYAKKVIRDIVKRGKLPILCGGTAHWMDAVIYEQQFPEVGPNKKLRASLEKLTAEKLFAKLKKLDPARASTIDAHNSRRLIRALEIIEATGKPVAPVINNSPYNILWLGITVPQEKLQAKIKKRLTQRIKQGMFHETEKLHKQGVSWQQLWSFGLEYRFGSEFLQGKLTAPEAAEQLYFAITHYAKRQMTWWKRNTNIHWISSTIESKDIVQKFIKNK